jgi:hypothetical protein
MDNKEKQFAGAVNVKQNCICMGVSRAVTQISTSNLVAFFMQMKDVQLIRQVIKIIISLAFVRTL